MYIDPEIKLRSDMPEELNGYFKELQEYYDAGDWLNFDLLMELVEGVAKSYQLVGKITYDELQQIFHKYGIG